MIKFFDLQNINTQYVSGLEEISSRVIDYGWYLLGNEVKTLKSNNQTLKTNIFQ